MQKEITVEDHKNAHLESAKICREKAKELREEAKKLMARARQHEFSAKLFNDS